MARNDVMTALLDTRRALEEHVTALGEHVESARREVAETVTSQVADLHADNRETRSRVNSMSTALAETNKSVPALRQEVADLARSVQTLHAAVNDIALRLPCAPEQAPAGVAPSPAPAIDHDAASGVSVAAGTPALGESAAPGAEQPEEDDAVVPGPPDGSALPAPAGACPSLARR